MAKKTKSDVVSRVYELPESVPCDSGFSLFKRRLSSLKGITFKVKHVLDFVGLTHGCCVANNSNILIEGCHRDLES